MINKSISLLILCIGLALVSCKTTDRLTDNVENAEEQPKNIGTVLVDLQPDYSSEELAEEFKEYELTPISITSKTLNAWAFSYNADNIEELKLLSLLAKNEYVKRSRRFNVDASKSKMRPTITREDLPVR